VTVRHARACDHRAGWSTDFAAISAGGFAKPMARGNARLSARRARQDAHNLPIGNFD
jgi:hypothetical protein